MAVCFTRRTATSPAFRGYDGGIRLVRTACAPFFEAWDFTSSHSPGFFLISERPSSPERTNGPTPVIPDRPMIELCLNRHRGNQTAVVSPEATPPENRVRRFPLCRHRTHPSASL